MIILRGGGKFYLPNRYSEVNYHDAIKVSEIPRPKELEDEKIKLTKEVVLYYNKCISIFTGGNFHLFANYIYELIQKTNIDTLIRDICNNTATLPIKSVKKYKGGKIIKDKDIGDDLHPLYEMIAIELIECLNASTNGIGGGIAIAAILYRDRSYKENLIINKIKRYKKIDLNTVYYAVYKLSEFLKYIENDYPAIFFKGNNSNKAIHEFAGKKSGINDIGYYSWIDEVATRSNQTHKEVENMPVYDFLRLLNIVKAEKNYKSLIYSS